MSSHPARCRGRSDRVKKNLLPARNILVARGSCPQWWSGRKLRVGREKWRNGVPNSGVTRKRCQAASCLSQRRSRTDGFGVRYRERNLGWQLCEHGFALSGRETPVHASGCEKKLRRLEGGKKNAGKQSTRLAPYRRKCTSFGDVRSPICTGREDHGTGKFSKPAAWKPCATPFLALPRFGWLRLVPPHPGAARCHYLSQGEGTPHPALQ